MTDNNHFDNDDTLSQQRKARQEFLELKRMQSGAVEPPPPPSAEAEVPVTFGDKFKNFWYYYRIHVICTFFMLIVIAVCIHQCATRVNYDMEIAIYTANPVSDDDCKKINEYLENCYRAEKGDDELKVNVINCSYTQSGNVEIARTMDSKIQAILVAETDTMLFIVDETTLSKLNSIASKNVKLFGDDYVTLGSNFYNKCDAKDYLKLPEGLILCRRNISDTTMEKNKSAKDSFKEAGILLKKLAKEQ